MTHQAQHAAATCGANVSSCVVSPVGRGTLVTTLLTRDDLLGKSNRRLLVRRFMQQGALPSSQHELAMKDHPDYMYWGFPPKGVKLLRTFVFFHRRGCCKGLHWGLRKRASKQSHQAICQPLATCRCWEICSCNGSELSSSAIETGLLYGPHVQSN